jgi:hypothetical protein
LSLSAILTAVSNTTLDSRIDGLVASSKAIGTFGASVAIATAATVAGGGVIL